MWDLPGPGLKPAFPALAGGFLTTVPPGKPSATFLSSPIFPSYLFQSEQTFIVSYVQGIVPSAFTYILFHSFYNPVSGITVLVSQ